MNETGERITCFNGEECIYLKCKQFCKPLDTCNFMVIGLLSGFPPVAQPKQEKPQEGVRSIGTLKTGEKSSKDNKIIIEGTLVNDPEIRDVNTQDGPTELAKLLLEDGSGQIQLTYWGDETKKVKKYKAGQTLRVENVWKIDSPYNDVPQATPGKYSKITLI